MLIVPLVPGSVTVELVAGERAVDRAKRQDRERPVAAGLVRSMTATALTSCSVT